MGVRGLILLSVGVLASSAICRADNISANPFGALSAYNLVALGYTDSHGHVTAGTISGNRPDVTGRIAAADTVSAGQYGTTIGSSLGSDPFGSSSSYLIVAGTGIAGSSPFYLNGPGNVYAPGSAGTLYFNNNPQGHREPAATGAAAPIDWNAQRALIDAQTAYLGTLGNVGTVTGPNSGATGLNGNSVNPDWLVLKGANSASCPCTFVFNITGAQFGSTHAIDIEIPDGSTAIVNVTGSAPSLGTPIFHNGQQHASTDPANDKIVFNFPQASSVTINNELSATLLAPFAVVTGTSQLDGNIIAAQIGATGEVHNVEFTGHVPTPPTTPQIPAIPEPGTLTLLGTGMLLVAGIIRRKGGS